MTIELLPCPFCGNTPSISEPEWRDDNRYYAMDISCCSTLEVSIGWIFARNLTEQQRKEHLDYRALKEWNEPLFERAHERDEKNLEDGELMGLIDNYITNLERTHTGWYARTRDGYTAEGDNIMTTVTKAISLSLFDRVGDLRMH